MGRGIRMSAPSLLFAIDVRTFSQDHLAEVMKALMAEPFLATDENICNFGDAEILYYEGPGRGLSHSSYRYYKESESCNYPLFNARFRTETKIFFDGFESGIIMVGNQAYRLMPVDIKEST